MKLKTYTLWIAHHYVVKLSYTFFLQSLPSARCITTLNSLRLLALLGTIFRRNKQLFVDARSSKITAFRVMSSLILGICYQRKREKKRNNTSDSTVCFIDCSLLCWHIKALSKQETIIGDNKNNISFFELIQERKSGLAESLADFVKCTYAIL